ncbi:MAG: hypothetical protein QGG36_32250 [Pirellulaceae bacterium]|jgi:hypothetical protein|nr:hypothetical protein [Pirellulaceae bacterium]MDP7020516.1 hypothetical protein [Pirellulaceae bacterium]
MQPARFYEDHLRDQNRLGLVAVTGGVIAGSIYFAVLFAVSQWVIPIQAFSPHTASVITMAALIGAFIVLMTPIVLGIRPVHELPCPKCDSPIQHRNIQEVIKTRRCPACESQIVDGPRTYSRAVYRRFCQIQSRARLASFLWSWIGAGAAATSLGAISRGALGAGFLFLLNGWAMSCWSVLRTRDRRCIGPAVVSTLLLAAVCYVIWRMDFVFEQ